MTDPDGSGVGVEGCAGLGTDAVELAVDLEAHAFGGGEGAVVNHGEVIPDVVFENGVGRETIVIGSEIDEEAVAGVEEEGEDAVGGGGAFGNDEAGVVAAVEVGGADPAGDGEFLEGVEGGGVGDLAAVGGVGEGDGVADLAGGPGGCAGEGGVVAVAGAIGGDGAGGLVEAPMGDEVVGIVVGGGGGDEAGPGGGRGGGVEGADLVGIGREGARPVSSYCRVATGRVVTLVQGESAVRRWISQPVAAGAWLIQLRRMAAPERSWARGVPEAASETR